MPSSPQRETKAEDNTPIIFLHGWRSEAAVWLPIIKKIRDSKLGIQKKYKLYAIDLPGFGKSETPKTALTLHDYAEIVRKCIAKIQPTSNLQLPTSNPQPFLIGHSFGARVALKLAAENQNMIKKLVLVGSGGARRPEIKRKMLNMLAQCAKPFFTLRCMQSLRKKIYAMLGAEDYVATPELKETYLNIIREPLEPLFPRIQTPTLIVWGANDTEIPLAYGQKMRRAILHARFAVIENAGHFCFLDQPEKFIQILEKWVINNS